MACAVYLYSEIELPIRRSQCVDIMGSLGFRVFVIFNCSWRVVLFFPSTKSFVFTQEVFVLLGNVFTETTFMRHVILVRDIRGSVEGIYILILDDVS